MATLCSDSAIYTYIINHLHNSHKTPIDVYDPARGSLTTQNATWQYEREWEWRQMKSIPSLKLEMWNPLS